MPTFERADKFDRDWKSLSAADRGRFLVAVRKFVEDLEAGGPFRPGLRVKGVRGYSGVFEMTWAPDGRATFGYGDPVRPGDAHVIWRRVGTHDVIGGD